MTIVRYCLKNDDINISNHNYFFFKTRKDNNHYYIK